MNMKKLKKQKEFKITLELFDDCSGYDPNDLTTAHWQLMVNGKDIGQLNTYDELHKALDYILDMETLIFKPI